MKIITGLAKGMNLETLEGEATRPTSQRVKEAVSVPVYVQVSDALSMAVAAAIAAVGAGADGLKKVLNVTLKPYFRNSAVIVTNQDGLNYLDTLKDKNDQYLLKPEVADQTQYRFAGFPVKVYDNDTMPSNTATSGKLGIPFIVGDLKEAVVMFERKGINILSSNVAGDAFAQDMTYFRAIEREVVKIRDAAAVVNGVMTVDIA